MEPQAIAHVGLADQDRVFRVLRSMFHRDTEDQIRNDASAAIAAA